MVHNKFFVRARFLAGVGTWLCRGEPRGAAGNRRPSPSLPPGPSKLTWRKMCSLYLFTSPELRRHHRLSRLARTTCRASQSLDRVPLAWASVDVALVLRLRYATAQGEDDDFYRGSVASFNPKRIKTDKIRQNPEAPRAELENRTVVSSGSSGYPSGVTGRGSGRPYYLTPGQNGPPGTPAAHWRRALHAPSQ